MPDIRHKLWLPAEWLAPDTYRIEPWGADSPSFCAQALSMYVQGVAGADATARYPDSAGPKAVKLTLKGVLHAAGVEVPKIHDVGNTLREHMHRLPPQIAAEIDTLASTSRRLREERELAFYGDEETGTEAEALFSRADAGDALRSARHVVRV